MTHDIDWDDPAARARLIDRIGPQAYNAAIKAHHAKSVVATVNGYTIRPVMSRFGRLFQIDGLQVAYQTLEQAKAKAAEA